MVVDLAALPDGEPLPVLARLNPMSAEFPILACARAGQEELAESVLTLGTSDLVFLEELDGPRLLRAIRFALWRQTCRPRQLEALMTRVEETLQGLEEALRRELELPQEGDLPRLSEEARLRFRRLIPAYAVLLDMVLAVDGRAGEASQSVAEELGFLKAGPLDLVELHKHALTAVAQSRPELAPRYVTEGRLVLLQVMGRLAAYYRSRALAQKEPC